MNFKVVPIKSFLKEVKYLSKKHPSLKEDLIRLGNELKLNPKSGIPIGRNCYKIRLQITSKGKGKSGGARVITHLIINIDSGILYLLKIYDKGDLDNISETELKSLLSGIENL